MSPLDPQIERRMNEHAREARAEFEANWQNWTVKDVALWWRKWCTMEGTNHDRLGKILMEATGVKKSAAVPANDLFPS
jgi:hypothetical protein